MKITHVVPHIDREASGPSYSVPRLCQSLASLGDVVELRCLAASRTIPGVQLSVHRQWPLLSRFAVSTDMLRALRRSARDADIVHNHSLWSMVNVAAGYAVPGRSAKLVTSPRGTLSTLAMARRKSVKRCLWPFQKRVLERADLLHATSEAEYADIRDRGFCAPVAVIPNGIDLPSPQPLRAVSETRELLFLSRIHPIKGIDNLLRAWQRLEPSHPEWRLVIAGNGEARHVDLVQKLAATLGVQRVQFPGPLYGGDKSAAYRRARLFVLPTHSENFGMVVAEALAHACPVIVTQGAPWSGLEVEGCGWWVRDELSGLEAALDAAMRLPDDQLAAMGAKGRDWMDRDFSWESVGSRMDAAYHWLLTGGRAPGCVRLE